MRPCMEAVLLNLTILAQNKDSLIQIHLAGTGNPLVQYGHHMLHAIRTEMKYAIVADIIGQPASRIACEKTRT